MLSPFRNNHLSPSVSVNVDMYIHAWLSRLAIRQASLIFLLSDCSLPVAGHKVPYFHALIPLRIFLQDTLQ
jgi:hypothetical protein